jgi:hypothetical protein
METIEGLDQLAAQARQENVPPTTIDMRKLVRQCQNAESPVVARVMWWSVGVSAAAACLALWLSTHAVSTQSDSDTSASLFAPVKVEMP